MINGKSISYTFFDAQRHIRKLAASLHVPRAVSSEKLFHYSAYTRERKDLSDVRNLIGRGILIGYADGRHNDPILYNTN